MVSKANLFLPDWYNNGIISIADIVFGNGKFISQNDLKTVYHIRTNFWSITESLPVSKIT